LPAALFACGANNPSQVRTILLAALFACGANYPYQAPKGGCFVVESSLV